MSNRSILANLVLLGVLMFMIFTVFEENKALKAEIALLKNEVLHCGAPSFEPEKIVPSFAPQPNEMVQECECMCKGKK